MTKCWLVTWTTYGTWLPGDPRGFRTWRGHEYVPPPHRYARNGEQPYNPLQYQNRYQSAQAAVGEKAVLSAEQQVLVVRALIEEIQLIAMTPIVMSIGATHIHLLSWFGAQVIRPTVGRIKAAATRSLHDHGFPGKRIWSKNCHMESKATERDVQNAFDYVCRHVQEGCLVHRWSSPSPKPTASLSKEPTPRRRLG